MYELLVKGMSCDHCVMTVKRLASSVEGVSDVQVDLESGKVQVTADSSTREAVVASINKIFEVVA